MADLIDRQAVLSTLRSLQTYLFNERDEDKKIDLRSAEAAVMHLTSFSCGHEDDLISRQAAIDALDAACIKYSISPNYDDKRTDKEKFSDWWDMHKVLSMKIIEGLPSAQPERKKGQWITKSTNGELFDVCSICGYVEWDTPSNYCSNCGADMREEGGE